MTARETRPHRAGTLLALLPLVVALVLVWFSPFDHPLYPHDEGRYAAVAAHMVDSGDWVIPVFKGHTHLTKPPLTYWLEAASVTLFGRSEVAARMPAMVASSAVLVMLFAFVARRRGRMAAGLTVGLYSILPLALVVGRIGATDAILNAWWTLAVLSGFLAIDTNRGRWRATFWVAIALAALTKGPLALGPLGILFVWLVLAGRTLEIDRLGLAWLPVAFVPVSIWIFAVASRGHDVLSIWWMESAGRADGSLGKHEPWWFYVPIFLLGFFPATAMMTLPWFNLTFASAWRSLRSGSLHALLVLAVLVPFAVFSIASGKLPTYLLPLAAPMAILTAENVRGWIDGRFDRVLPGFTPPDVRITVAICSALAAVAIPIAARFGSPLVRPYWVHGLALALPAVVGLLAIALWKRRDRRLVLVGAFWAALASVWIWAFHEEDILWEPRSQAIVMRVVSDSVGPRARVVVIGTSDQTRHFYFGGDIHDLGPAPDWAIARAEMNGADACIIDMEIWPSFRAALPDLAGMIEPLGTGPAFLGGEVMIARVAHGHVVAN